jgi:signal transduction histidine kinase
MDKNNTDALNDQFSALISEGEQAWMRSEYSDALQKSELALELAGYLSDEEKLGKAYYLKGLSLCYLNNYDDAMDNYLKALNIHEKIQDRNFLAEDYNGIGHIYINLKEYDKALEYFKRSHQTKPEYYRTVNNLAVVHIYMKDYEKARHYGEKALAISRKAFENGKEDRGHIRSYIIALINLANIIQKSGDPADSVSLLQEALSLSENYNEQTTIVSLSLLAETYINLQKYDQAADYLHSADQKAKDHKNKEVQKDILRLYHQLFARQEKFQQAYDYLKQYHELDRKIYSDEMSRNMTNLRTRHELERKELENRRLAEHASKLATVSVISGGITHEINQPLCAIKVSAESIQYWNENNSKPLPKDIEESLSTIIEASDKIDEIIRHMRSFWNEKETSEIEPVNLNKLVENALGLMERQLFSHGIYLIKELTTSEALVLAEPVHIEQMILNIVVNALYALDSIKDKDKKITISTEIKNNNVVLKIVDNGPGLPTELPEKLYDPFFSTRQPGKGMGLGLAIVKQYADRWGIELSASNNAVKGACFQLSFPQKKEN